MTSFEFKKSALISKNAKISENSDPNKIQLHPLPNPKYTRKDVNLVRGT